MLGQGGANTRKPRIGATIGDSKSAPSVGCKMALALGSLGRHLLVDRYFLRTWIGDEQARKADE